MNLNFNPYTDTKLVYLLKKDLSIAFIHAFCPVFDAKTRYSYACENYAQFYPLLVDKSRNLYFFNI